MSSLCGEGCGFGDADSESPPERELRSQYSLGFISDEPNEISEFRALKLSTKQKSLVVQGAVLGHA